MDRRTLLKGFVGCSLAANPWVTPIAFAGSPDSGRLGDNRLVVIILRGGMDGLDVVQPYGDGNLAQVRQRLAVGPQNGALDLDGFFALNKAFHLLHPLWQAGEMGFAHAVSTPYRDKRSHFDGQDLLEAGTARVQDRARDGWLNRMLQQVPGLEANTAYSVGLDQMAVLAGPAPVSDWAPDVGVTLSPQGKRLLEVVMHDDPLFQRATAEAMDILGSLAADPGAMDGGQEMMMSAGDTGGDMGGGEMGAAMMDMAPANIAKLANGTAGKLAEFTANRLRGDARIAAFSLGGWDTHGGQERSMRRAAAQLSVAILRLRQELGPVWNKTTVLAMTEFGRTVYENGTAGTDHGTGGLALFAGGAVRGGQVITDWPGVREEDRYKRRDLMPTRDVRAFAGWAMRGLYGFDRSLIETVIFPGLDLGSDPGMLL